MASHREASAVLMDFEARTLLEKNKHVKELELDSASYCHVTNCDYR